MLVAACGVLFAACGVVAPAGPPAVVLAHSEVDAGRLVPGEERRLTLPWRRTGAGSLRVLAVETDCGCALAAGPSGRQDEGAHGEIGIRLSATRRPGPFAHRVTLYTDQPSPRDVVACIVRGWCICRLAFAPACLDLGPRSPGVRVEREAEVRIEPSIEASIKASMDAGGQLVARLVGLDGSVAVLPPARHGVPGRLLQIAVRTPADAGPFEGGVLLEREGAPLATLPIRGRVSP